MIGAQSVWRYPSIIKIRYQPHAFDPSQPPPKSPETRAPLSSQSIHLNMAPVTPLLSSRGHRRPHRPRHRPRRRTTASLRARAERLIKTIKTWLEKTWPEALARARRKGAVVL
jgi:hypothetical protein